MSDIFESLGSDDSPMRLHGSSASSASVASRLYGTRSRRDSLGSDPELISFSDSDMHDITNQVTMISKKLSEMEEQQLHSNDERGRLRTENAVLTERVHVLEEQLLLAEQRFREQLQEEKSRTKELLQRLEREKLLETESLTLKYQMLEKDLQAAKKDAEKAREETARAQDTVEDLRGQLVESKLLVEDLEDERVKLERQFKRFKEEAQQDIDSSSEIVEVLTQQTEELRRNGPHRQGSIVEQMSGLEESLEQARSVIRDLQRERDDLQAQLLATSVERGRTLLADQPSLADELMSGGGNSEQILEALREQEVCNQKLRVYINGILIRVIERHPEILEIERLPFSLKSLSLDNVEQVVKESPKKTTKNREHKKRVKRKAPAKERKSLTDNNTSTSTSNGIFGRVSQNKDTKQMETKQQFSTFEEIMDRAARKISAVTMEGKPSTSTLSKEEEALAEKRSRTVPSVSVDTTTIHFDNPIWDNPELRAELLDSEEEFALDASPPTLQEDSTVVDELIDEATHAVDSNPIDHERKDEMVTGWSSDEDDYSTLDLRQIRRLDSNKSLVLPAVRKHFLNEGNYERSIDVADEI